MTWEPEPRPDWLISFNDGRYTMAKQDADKPLDPALLMADAQASLGLSDTEAAWGDGDFVEPLTLVLNQLETAANLTLFGRWYTRRFVLRLLQGRLQLGQYAKSDPEVVDEVISEPIFVVGAPRTGTTLMHTLLATDPGLRAPEGWELLHPVPPPGDVSVDEARVAKADHELGLLHQVKIKLDTIHTYRGRMLKECLSAMSFSFRSEEFISRYHVPDYVDWLQACDMTPAYEMHRSILQVLQRRSGATNWVLKSPVHMHNLPVLLQVYPDAKLVITHRDPLTVLASVTSLLATLRHAQTDHVDVAAIGRYHADLYCGSLDRLVTLTDDGTVPADRVVHIHYRDTVANPVETIVDLYAKLGIEQTQAAGEALTKHVTDNPRKTDRKHEYSFDSLGIDRSKTRKQLERYAERFNVEMAP